MRNRIPAVSLATFAMAIPMAAQNICSPALIQMAAASQPKDTVIKMIKKSNCDLSLADVLTLGKAGVSEDIIEAAAPSMRKSAPTASPSSGTQAVVANQLTPESTTDVEAYINGKKVASIRSEMINQPLPSEKQMLITRPHLVGRHSPMHDIVLDGTETRHTIPADPDITFIYATNLLTNGKLVHIKPRKDDRLLYSAEMLDNKNPKGDFIDIDIKEGAGQNVTITPRKPLTPGESYAFISQGNLMAWAFRVEKN
jgi:hypothetical protein